MVAVKCKNCGADISAQMKFCGTCGAPVEHTEAAQTPVSPVPAISTGNPPSGIQKNIKKFLIPAIALVLLIVAGSVLWNIFKPSNYEQTKGTLYIAQFEDGVIIEPDGKSATTIEGRLINSARSLDNTKAAVLISEDEGDNYGYSLYLVADTVTFIADGVSDVKLALSGAEMAFVRDIDYDSGEGELCLYSGGKTSTVSDEYFTRYGFVLSPDGNTVGFTIGDNDRFSGYCYSGKQIELGTNVIPVAVADGAKYIYYDRNSSFYVMKGNNEDTREKLGENVYSYWFNKDLSQVVYSYGNKSYFSRGGGKRESLSGFVQSFLLPAGAAGRDNIVGVGSFAHTFYVSDSNAVVRINGKFETGNVDRSVSSAHLASDGKTIIYQKRDGIYKIDGSKENAASVELVDGDVDVFIPTADGNAVYFYTTDDELFYQKGKGKPVSVGEYLYDSVTYGYWAMFKGDQLFYISDEELYTSTGSKGKRVDSFDERVTGVFGGLFSLTVQTTDDYDQLRYRSKDGKSFELLGVY
jgi:hypothetical protein